MAWQNYHNPKRIPKAKWERIRARARVVLDYRCQACGNGVDKLELDHIVPVAFGGSNALDNLQWLCVQCHKEKTKADAKIGHERYKRATLEVGGQVGRPRYVRRRPQRPLWVGQK